MNGNPLEFNNLGEITFSDVANPRVINLGPGNNTFAVTAAGGGVIISGDGGLISGGTITKTGAGALRMDGNQAQLTSDWIVNEGTLEARTVAPLGSGKVTVNPGARLSARNAPVTNDVILAGGDLATRSGDGADFQGSVNVTAASTVTMHSYTTPANPQNITISGVLSGTGDLTLNGNIVADPTTAKALILTNTANTYAGTLRVSEGQTLQLDGNLTSTASQAVVTGTLSGRGTIAGKVTTNALGTIAPGLGIGVLGAAILTVGGDVVMSPTSILSLDLARPFDPTAPVAGTDYDQLNIGTGTGAVSTGTVTLDGAELRLTLNTAVLQNDLFFLVLNDGVDPISGTFLNTPDDSVIDIAGQAFRISYDANSTTGLLSGGNDVALVAIPEPGSASLALLSLPLLLRRRLDRR
jgi:autotransporter-associated beta strand protein